MKGNKMLTDIQKHWDNSTLTYDLEKYDWPGWALSVIQEIAPEVKELETMHKVLPVDQMIKVRMHKY